MFGEGLWWILRRSFGYCVGVCVNCHGVCFSVGLDIGLVVVVGYCVGVLRLVVRKPTSRLSPPFPLLLRLRLRPEHPRPRSIRDPGAVFYFGIYFLINTDSCAKIKHGSELGFPVALAGSAATSLVELLRLL